MAARYDEVVDTMCVPASGDAGLAIRKVGKRTPREVECEILVLGGGTGGAAAALAAARAGREVVIVEETDWLGGQMTSQGVSALDEHEHIETFGGTASYYALRNALRAHYGCENPGSCWVTRLAFEPCVAAGIIEAMLPSTIGVFKRSKPVAVEMQGDGIVAVTCLNLESGELLRFRPRMVIDATELGDLLPLAGAEYVVGAETVAQTGEAQAQPREPKAHCVQSFTYTFACERRPKGERHVIPKPEKYEHYRDTQPYSLRIEVHGGEIYGEESGWLQYSLFDRLPGTKGGLWTYRRLVEKQEVTMFNWPGNDYRDGSIIDCPPLEAARALQDAKRVSLGFLYWLQQEAPELKLRPDVMGTADGLSKHPYIRESRRIRALKTIVEQEVSAHYQKGPLAARFADSVGVGWYPIDIHRSGPDDVGASCRTKPFQIPLGALIPVRISNLIAGAKNIGTTHITNGCYRLHPVEWNIGEAAGALAAFCLQKDSTPRNVRDEKLRPFQELLREQGVPLEWPKPA
jgi:FAD dependent oxidoreductase